MIEKGCCTGQRAAALAVFYTKIRPGHRRVNGALKTHAVFSLRQDPCKAGLMPQAEQGICTQTLCSRHTRGVLSRTLAGALVSQAPAQKEGNEIRFFDRSVRYRAKRSACSVHGKGKFPQFRTAALRSNRRCGAAALHTGKSRGRWFIWCLCRCFETAYLYSSTRRVRCS